MYITSSQTSLPPPQILRKFQFLSSIIVLCPITGCQPYTSPCCQPPRFSGAQLGSEELLLYWASTRGTLWPVPHKAQSRAAQSSTIKSSVLAVARTELIFSVVAGMVLCFGSGTKTVVIRQRCFSYCLHSTKAVRCCFSCCPPPASRLGAAQEAGDRARTMTPVDRRDIPDNVPLCSAINTGKKELWCLSSQVTGMMKQLFLLSSGWLNTCLPAGSTD